MPGQWFPEVASWFTGSRTVHAAKVAVAATLAWVLVVPWGGVADHYPYYAPLGAVASVAGTVAGSARATLSSVVAIALGAVPAIVAIALPVPGAVALAGVVLVGAWLAGWERLGPNASWVPISGLFILIIGHRDPWTFAGAYIGLVAVGALVGLAVNTVWPALPLRSAQHTLDRLRDVLARQLHELADGLADEQLPTSEGWAERRHATDRHADEMIRVVTEAREAERVNWRATRWRETAGRQYRQARALEQLSFFVEDAYDLVARTEKADLDEVALGPELRPAAARALRATADLLSGLGDDSCEPATWQETRATVDELAKEIIHHRTGTPYEYFAAGSLVTTLRRTLDSVAPDAPDAPAAR